jgi:hypothetical protein
LLDEQREHVDHGLGVEAMSLTKALAEPWTDAAMSNWRAVEALTR